MANRAWFLHEIADAKRMFLEAHAHAKAGEFYKAWCALERVEIALIGIAENPLYDLDDFGIPEFRALIENWQKLFPYKIFFSPEFRIKSEECSICGTAVSPWGDCGHRVWKVYNGEPCSLRVTGLDILGISLVLDPVQKYSVAFLDDKDHYDYRPVAHLVERIASPFDRFVATLGNARHPHSLFPDVQSSDLCSCKSGQSYGACCEKEGGILQPHLYIELLDEVGDGHWVTEYGHS